MQRSLSLSESAGLKIKNPLELEDDEEDDNQSLPKSRSSDMDDDDDVSAARRLLKDGPGFSPRKAVAEEVASFQRSSSNASVTKLGRPNGSSPVASPAAPAESAGAGSAQTKQELLDADYIEIRRAILAGKLEDVKHVVEGEPDRFHQMDVINHVSGKDGYSPLMVAVSCEEDKADLEMVRYLLANGARKNVVDTKGNTCLHWAAFHGQAAVLRELIDTASDIGRQNNDGDTPLHVASRLGRVECCEILLSYFGAAVKSEPASSVATSNGEQTAFVDGASRTDGGARSKTAEGAGSADDAANVPASSDAKPSGDGAPQSGADNEERGEPKSEGSASSAVDATKSGAVGEGEPSDGTSAADGAADASMAGLLSKKESAETKAGQLREIQARIRQRRREAKASTLKRLTEDEQNQAKPHHILVCRNRDFETPFDVAAKDVTVDDIVSGTPAMIKATRIKRVDDARRAIHRAFMQTSEFFKTLILHHADCFDHIPFGEDGRDIWEAPERLSAILQGVAESVDSSSVVISSKFERASREMLERAHAPEYVDFVCKLQSEVQTASVPFTPMVQRKVFHVEEGNLKKNEHCDTSFSPGSLNAALSASGAVCHAIDRVVGGVQRNAFCVVRPPGHHAGINGLLQNASSCGFCIFNNVAIGAMHAMAKFPNEIKRVAIVDFDVHHGNGTEEIVNKINREAMEKQQREGKPPVAPLMFFSSHVYDAARPGSSYEFYPGSGHQSNATTNIINAPMQPLWRRRGYRRNIDGRRSWAERFYFDHFGRTEFRRVIKERLLPALRMFCPDLVLISAGFDASRRDVGNGRYMGRYCSGFDLQRQDFTWIAGQVSRIANITCKGRVVSVLEGGYGRLNDTRAGNAMTIDRTSLARNCVAHVSGLIDAQTRLEPDESESEDSDEEKLDKDTEDKLNSRRMRTRRPPKRFEGKESAKRRSRRADSSGPDSEDERASTANGVGRKDRPAKRPKREEKADAARSAEAEAKAAEEKRSLALQYLRRVKRKYANDIEVYKKFLIIMGHFKHGSIGVTQVIESVKSLFAGDRKLIEDFNTFLPPGYTITLTAEEAGAAGASSSTASILPSSD